MNYYISDAHYFHNNVIKFDNRLFKDLNEMHEKMAIDWNNKVTNADHVYILGDLSWKVTDEAINLIKSLHGNLHLVLGNHDHINNAKFKKLFEEITPYKELKDIANGQVYNLVLFHYPITFWNKQHYGSIHLYGHVHNSYEEDIYQDIIKQLNDKWDIECKAYNVGCMMPYMNYIPRTLEEIINANKL